MVETYQNKGFENEAYKDEFGEPTKNNSEEMKEESLLDDFCKHTTGHGFIKLIETANLLHNIWIGVMVATSVCLLIHLNLLLARYLAYGINTAFYLTQDNQVIMPDITVCPNAKFAFVQSQNLDGVPDFYPGSVFIGQQSTFLELFNHYTNLWTAILGNQSDINLSRYSIMREAYRAKTFRSRYDIIIQMTYKNLQINTSVFGETFFGDSQICATYQPVSRVLNFTNGNDDAIFMVSSYYVGDDNSYEMGTRALKEMNTFIVGSSIYVHAAGTIANYYTDGVKIAVGNIGLISFKQQNVLRKEVNNNCISNTQQIVIRGYDLGQTKTYEYSTYLCTEIKKSLILYQRCGCRSELLFTSIDVPDSAPFCHEIPQLLNMRINNTFIFESDLSQVQGITGSIAKRHLCHDQQYNLLSNANFAATCQPNCVEVSYETDFSSILIYDQSSSFTSLYQQDLAQIQPLLTSDSRNPNMSLALQYFSPGEDVRLRMTLIRITPKTLSVEVAEDSLSYPLGNYFSDVGGIFGLYLGFSVISILEICELLFNWLFVNKGKCRSVKSK